MFNAALLAIVEEAGLCVLTLTEAVEAEEMRRSQLTLGEVYRQLKQISTTLTSLASTTRTQLPEIAWDDWDALARVLTRTPPVYDESIEFAVHSLVPQTLTWLRIYRKNQPELFSFQPA